MAVAHYIPFRAIRAGAVFKNYIEMGIKHSSSIIILDSNIISIKLFIHHSLFRLYDSFFS